MAWKGTGPGCGVPHREWGCCCSGAQLLVTGEEWGAVWPGGLRPSRGCCRGVRVSRRGCWGGAVQVPPTPQIQAPRARFRAPAHPKSRAGAGLSPFPPRAPWGAPSPRSEDEDGIPKSCPGEADLPSRLVPVPTGRRVGVSGVSPGGRAPASPGVAADRGLQVGKLRHGIAARQSGGGRWPRALSRLTRPACGPGEASCDTRGPALARGGRGAAASHPGLTHAEILLAWLKSPSPSQRPETGWGLPRPPLPPRFPELSRSAASRRQQKAAGGERGACLPVSGRSAGPGGRQPASEGLRALPDAGGP